jgi:hypothetical protein
MISCLQSISCLMLIASSLSLLQHGIGDSSRTYSKLTANHNHQNYEILPTVGDVNYTSYEGYNIRNITSLLTKQSWEQSFDTRGNFRPLVTKLNQKLMSAKRNNDSITLNVLYIGGSVCVGHGCFPTLSTEQMKNEITADMLLRASFHCSWPHRFTIMLQHILSKYIDSFSPNKAMSNDDTMDNDMAPSKMKVSPRYCCRAATSSNTGMDILLTRAYAAGCCAIVKNKTEVEDDRGSSWEPDLVIWDYSVNDMHSQVGVFVMCWVHWDANCLISFPYVHYYAHDAVVQDKKKKSGVRRAGEIGASHALQVILCLS